MKNCNPIKVGLLIGTIIILISSIVAPMVIGYNIRKPDRRIITDNYDCYHNSEIPNFIQYNISIESNTNDNFESEKISKSKEAIQPLNGLPMDSPWPMYCHDVRHTGRSPYNTANNPGTEKWRIGTGGWATGSPIIGEDGIIYMGAKELHAIYPNGTLKWKYDIPHKIVSAAAIDENGVIYIGTIEAMPNYLYAIYTSNGTLKWKYKTDNHIYSSPAIGNDGTIYFGSEDQNIYALYPNGTLKWKYKTGHAVLSSPAIGDDGTVYCGSHDTYLYAFHPNNGTVKWKYKTGNWIRVSPCIADDDTIYIVSLDDYLHAVYPNGTLKWKTDVGAGTSPTIGQDGTIYAGYRILHAINPNNGSIKWSFNPGSDRRIRGGTPCNSLDNLIYFGTHIGEYSGGELIAVAPDGTEKWRKIIATDWVDSAPAIGSDSTVYIGSANDLYHPGDEGYLHAIGELDPDAPSAPDIDGPKSGKIKIEYCPQDFI